MDKSITHMVNSTLKQEEGSCLSFVNERWENKVDKFLEIDVEAI